MENKIFDFIHQPSSQSIADKGTPDKSIREHSPESLPKILQFFSIKFLQIYGIRIVYSLLKSLFTLKSKGGFKGINLEFFTSAIFNMPNLRTAGFASVLTASYRLFNYIFKLFGKENIFTCLISGLISSLASVFIEEKTELMNFIILSVMVRTIYTVIVVLADKYKLPNYPRTLNTLVFIVACMGFIFIAFCHPTFTSIHKLFTNYANLENSEKEEVAHYVRMVRII